MIMNNKDRKVKERQEKENTFVWIKFESWLFVITQLRINSRFCKPTKDI